jgi:catechol 2,3-dioxygenase
MSAARTRRIAARRQVQPRRLRTCCSSPATLGDRVLAMGLRLSDRPRSGGFMHGIHGSDHHMLALVKSSAPGFHHCSWDVSSINDIGLGAMRMADKGYTKGWGLGRHVLGSNYFHYVRDPWGSFSEYSCDIDYIPKDERWPAADHKPEDSFYLWGPDVPREFTINYEGGES